MLKFKDPPMKRCPKCGQTYSDDSLNFCLTDGTALTTLSGDIPTVVIPREEKRKKGNGLLWAALIVFFILFGAASLVGLLIYRSGGKDDTKVAVNAGTPPPASTPRQRATSSPAASVEATPQASPAATSEDEDNSSDEVTPIGWETTAGGFKGEPGKTYRFECPAGGTAHGVYGSDIYTDYSSICTAAVHKGLITRENGGEVTIEYRPGREIYGSTTRNDIKTNTAGENGRSFVVR